jgi:hypothetical protein
LIPMGLAIAVPEEMYGEKLLTPSHIEWRFVYYKHQKRKTYRSWGIGVASLETCQ